MKAPKIMRDDWDDRARVDAFHYIASWRKDWDPASFFASGEEDYMRLVDPFLKMSRFDPVGKSALELGCGVGRMTRSFAQHFASVVAIDISADMLAQAKSYLPEMLNIAWVQGNGANLDGIDSQSADFAFSYIVLQHMPEAEITFCYVRELLRVVKPGGFFLFQFNGENESAMNWKGRAAWALVDLPWRLGLRKASAKIAALFGFDPALAGKSWRGAAIKTARMAEVVATAGGKVTETKGEGTPMAWLGGVKA